MMLDDQHDDDRHGRGQRDRKSPDSPLQVVNLLAIDELAVGNDLDSLGNTFLACLLDQPIVKFSSSLASLSVASPSVAWSRFLMSRMMLQM
jgi:hypothetical protein